MIAAVPSIVTLAVEGGTGVVLGGGRVVLQYLAPWSLKKIHMRLSGKVVIALGPPRAGKTSFMDFLLTGVLIEGNQDTDTTKRPVRRKDIPMIRAGRGNLPFMIKAPWDVPGERQEKIPAQIEYIERYKPHCAVVVLPEKDPGSKLALESSGAWLSRFCSELSKLLRKRASVTKNLKAVVVVMNMWGEFDKEVDEDEARRNSFKDAIDAPLNELTDLLESLAAYKGTYSIPRVPCVLVQNKHGDKYIVDVIERIALELSR